LINYRQDILVRSRYCCLQLEDIGVFLYSCFSAVAVDPIRSDEVSKALSGLEARLERSMKPLAENELDNMTQIAIVKELLSGRRTLSELVEAVYGLKRQDEGFKTEYTRVRREIAQLEARGFVSRGLFGRERPYRLTQLAVARLTRIAEVSPTWQGRLVTVPDLVIYSMAMVMAAWGFLVAWGATDTAPYLQWIRYVALFLAGLACSRFVGTLQKVI
jgi:hypothetical protein